jgi:hypothetical protein
MEYLPKIEYNEKRIPMSYLVSNKHHYDDFLGRIEEIVSGDCTALVANDEIIFNSYEPKSIKAHIEENIVKHEVRNYPHSLFAQMIEQKKDGKVTFYMYGNTPWFTVVTYSSDTNVLLVKYYKSLKYMNIYKDDLSD